MERHSPHESHPDHDETNRAEATEWAQYRALIRPEHLVEAEALYHEEPGAFLVYLDSYYLDEHPEDIRADFASIYAGSYPDRVTWAKDVIEVLGWDAALRRALQDASIPPDLLAWQPEALIGFAESLGFRLYEARSRVHVFHE
jgi:hypothetical protein